MGADMSLMKTGMATKTSISSNIPVECEITFDPSTKKVVTKWNLPQQVSSPGLFLYEFPHKVRYVTNISLIFREWTSSE